MFRGAYLNILLVLLGAVTGHFLGISWNTNRTAIPWDFPRASHETPRRTHGRPHGRSMGDPWAPMSQQIHNRYTNERLTMVADGQLMGPHKAHKGPMDNPRVNHGPNEPRVAHGSAVRTNRRPGDQWVTLAQTRESTIYANWGSMSRPSVIHGHMGRAWISP